MLGGKVGGKRNTRAVEICHNLQILKFQRELTSSMSLTFCSTGTYSMNKGINIYRPKKEILDEKFLMNYLKNMSRTEVKYLKEDINHPVKN